MGGAHYSDDPKNPGPKLLKPAPNKALSHIKKLKPLSMLTFSFGMVFVTHAYARITANFGHFQI
jgi:hypothetical protein